jgi:hypothetical protein
MLQLTRSAVEDSAGIVVKPPPHSRMLSGLLLVAASQARHARMAWHEGPPPLS